MGVEVFVEGRLRAAADFGMARLLVVTELLASGVVELRQQVERDVGRLIVGWIGPRNVMAQRAERRLPRHGARLLSLRQGSGVDPCQQAGRDRLDVALDA